MAARFAVAVVAVLAAGCAPVVQSPAVSPSRSALPSTARAPIPTPEPPSWPVAATSLELQGPVGLVVDDAGNVYISQCTFAPGQTYIYRVTAVDPYTLQSPFSDPAFAVIPAP